VLRQKRRVEPSEWRSISDRPRVLVENHDPAVGMAVQILLMEEGFEVAYCSGPGETVGRCPLVHDGVCSRAAEADVIFTSLHLGDNKHREIVSGLRRHFSDTPVVVELPAPKVSQYEDLLVGCEVVTKPVTRDRLVVAIRRALGGVEA